MSSMKLSTVVHRTFAFLCDGTNHVLSKESEPAATLRQQCLCIAGTCSKRCNADSTTTPTWCVSFRPREGQQTMSEQLNDAQSLSTAGTAAASQGVAMCS